MPPIYPANPGAITVLVNPGHGGGYNGAVSEGLFEKEVNLDVGLRLQRLLLAGGVNEVMTRTTDTDVNLPRVDVNGDGVIGRTQKGDDDWDELAARIDIGNEARADVHIFNHNNAGGCKCVRGTGTYVGMNRDWTPEGLALATFLQQTQLAQLDTFPARRVTRSTAALGRAATTPSRPLADRSAVAAAYADAGTAD